MFFIKSDFNINPFTAAAALSWHEVMTLENCVYISNDKNDKIQLKG